MSNSDTRPTIETVLERINAFQEGFNSRINEVEAKFVARFERLESEIAQMRQDMNTGFRKVERKVELLNRDFFASRADQEDILQRVESLESKSS
jgi:hypothetical protein